MKYKREVYQSLTLILQFGINMLVPIFLCTFIGIFIDKKLDTSFVFIIMFFLGAMAGARNVYIMAKRIYEKPSGTRDIKGAHITEGYEPEDDHESDKEE
ncbi:MAG: AtpZ/AtpI family protein [Lachnospiraceae bacterium]|nr:AtpZ/AtpI family protein [Lachnospiraceae bacterium]